MVLDLFRYSAVRYIGMLRMRQARKHSVRGHQLVDAQSITYQNTDITEDALGRLIQNTADFVLEVLCRN